MTTGSATNSSIQWYYNKHIWTVRGRKRQFGGEPRHFSTGRGFGSTEERAFLELKKLADYEWALVTREVAALDRLLATTYPDVPVTVRWLAIARRLRVSIFLVAEAIYDDEQAGEEP